MKKLTSIALLLALCLSLTAYAADEGFNAGITVTAEGDALLVTVQDSTVLQEKKPTLTVYCDGKTWTDVRVTFEGTVLPSTWAASDKGASFQVAQGGTYKLVSYAGADKVIHFAKADGTVETRTLTAFDTALPADSQDGQEFLGWSMDGQTVTALTEALYNALDDGQTVEGVFRAIAAPGPSVPMYTVTAPGKIPGGKITASPLSATAGARITVYAAPDAGYRLASLTAGGQPVTALGDGKYSFILPASPVKLEASFTAEAPDMPYTDVPEQEYYYDGLVWAAQAGITQDISGRAFGPNEACTRARIVTFLWRAAGSPEPAAANPFTDLDSGAYYYKAVLWALENGITVGTSATTFGPDETVTRAQAVTFLHRTAGTPAAGGSPEFADVPAAEYYAAAVAWALEEGITIGTGPDTFSPADDCIRGQIIAFLHRMMK